MYSWRHNSISSTQFLKYLQLFVSLFHFTKSLRNKDNVIDKEYSFCNILIEKKMNFNVTKSMSFLISNQNRFHRWFQLIFITEPPPHPKYSAFHISKWLSTISWTDAIISFVILLQEYNMPYTTINYLFLSILVKVSF